MQLSAEQRRFLIREQIIGSGVVNVLANGVIAWITFRSFALVPMWGPLSWKQQSIAWDIIATTFCLPWLTCMVVTPLVRKATREGKVAPIPMPATEVAVLRWLPTRVVLRSFVVSWGTAALILPPAIGLLLLLDVDALTLAAFVSLKALFSGVLAALVTPLIALYAMTSVQSAAVDHGHSGGSEHAVGSRMGPIWRSPPDARQ